jgi:hypothetical protein
MIDELEDLVLEAFENRHEARQKLTEVPARTFNGWLECKAAEADRTYTMYVDALELLRRRRDDLGIECVTDSVFTLEDAIHNGASVNEIFYGGYNTDGDLEEGESVRLASRRYDAGIERHNRNVSFA